MIIDFHTHVFPDRLAPRAVAALERSSGETAVLQATADALRASMREAGIDYALNLPIATKPEQTESINRFAEQVNGTQGLLSFGSVHPLCEDWRGALRRIRDAGLKGIKLHLDFQGLFVDDPRVVEVICEAGRLGLIVILHGGMDVSFRDLHRCTPERLTHILPDVRGTTLVIAHMGGYDYLDDVEKYLLRSELYIDTSATFGRSDEKQVARILRSFHPDRILFGSDSPWFGQRRTLDALRSLRLPEALERKILGENAARLLGIDR